MTNKIITGGLIIAVVLLGFLFLKQQQPMIIKVQTPLGEASAFHTNAEQFMDQVYISREADFDNALPGLATTTTGNLTAQNVCEDSIIDVTLQGIAGSNLTFPSSSGIFARCLTAVGNYRTLFFYNATTTGVYTLAISDGSSTLKVGVTSSTGGTATSSLLGKDMAKVVMLRTASGTTPWLYWLVEIYR